MDFSNAPEWATHYRNEKKSYFKQTNEAEKSLIWHGGNWITFRWKNHELDYPSNFTPIPQQSYMPAVGEECLCRWGRDPLIYYKVKVIGIDDDSIIFRWLEGKNEGCLGEDKQEIFAGCIGFKPLPTEEEVERERVIDHMLSLHAAHQWTPRQFAEALYDAGYHQESD